MNDATATRLPRIPQWPWVLAGLVAFAGLALSFSLRRARIAIERQAIETGFLADALRVRDAVAQEIALTIEVLDSIRQLHAISDQISAADFSEFVEKGMVYQRRILVAFGFVQRLDHVTRQLLEQSDAAESALRILEREPGGRIVSAAERPEYFPLTYQAPDEGLHVPVGFDFLSDPACREAIELMRRSGRSVVGGRAPAGAADEDLYYLYSPILYTIVRGVPAPPPGFLIGFTVALLHPPTLLERAQSSIAIRGLDVRLHAGASDVETASPGGAVPEPLRYTGAVQVADRTWVFECRADEDYLKTRISRQPVWILLGGLAVTGLLTFELLLMAGRAQRTERAIRARTRALHEAKTLLEREMTERLRLESEILGISEREKLRVGQDLHDSLGQKLTAASFLSRALSRKLEQEASEESDKIHRIHALLKEAVAQIRRIARGLAPVELGDAGLEDALRRLADDVRETYGIPCSVQIHGAPDMPAGRTAGQLYHIAQEALTNAARHGKPSRIGITLTVRDRDGELAIEDDGTGLPENAGHAGGMGLRIMRYRATMIGGSIAIENRAGGGTRIACRFNPVGKPG